MTHGQEAVRALQRRLVFATLFLLCGCVAGGALPTPIADFEPPTSCPTQVCPEPSPTDTFEEESPTATPTSSRTPHRTASPGARPTTAPTGIAPSGAPAPIPVLPVAGGASFPPFAFAALPFAQPFPLDPPPAPAPLATGPPFGLVAVAWLLLLSASAALGWAVGRRRTAR
jgi:hypothetical protein